MDNIFLDKVNIHNTWNTFLNSENIDILDNIYHKIKDDEITPQTKNILRFLETDLNSVKIIILGQDPYPQKGVATGRAFEVSTLESWHDTFRNVSLKNIVRTIYYAYNQEKLKFNEIKTRMSNKQFIMLPPSMIFKSWEEQGVMLLNTAFTCKVGFPDSHSKIWKPFTQNLLKFISQKENITWFLWGGNATNVVKNINIKNKFVNNHPMILKESAKDMLHGELNPFDKTKSIINWLGV